MIDFISIWRRQISANAEEEKEENKSAYNNRNQSSGGYRLI